MNCTWDNGEVEGDATYIFNKTEKEVSGNLLSIERQLSENEELLEMAIENIAITWYSIGLEQKMNKKYERAIETLQKAKSYLPASSDLSKLIHQQIKLIELDLVDKDS